jgi:aspartyl-tRNA(Asn)/glutamyl-tRNA(Gln) amidotransferase subunit B
LWKNELGREFRIKRIHLEEDTAKLVHQILDGRKVSLVDFNRSGVCLMELVTEPDFSEVSDVIYFLKYVQTVVRYLGISQADMEKGSMRLEANISLMPIVQGTRVDYPEVPIGIHSRGGINLPNYKVELKNINSFRFLEKAINKEVERQTEILNMGKTPKQETRGYSEKLGNTFSQRAKEEANDYRYFPEPDIPPFVFEEGFIMKLKNSLPELPDKKAGRYKSDFNLADNYINFLVSDFKLASYFDESVKLGEKYNISPTKIADLIVNKKLHKKFLEPAGLIKKVVEIAEEKFSGRDDTQAAVREVIKEETKAVSDYRQGKEQVLGFLVGMVQRKLKGKGDPKKIINLIEGTLIELIRKKHE